MHRCRTFLLSISLAFICLCSSARAQVPKTLNFQGILSSPDGPVVDDGSYAVTFKLYNVKSGGSEVYSETQTVSVEAGLFSVILGESVNGVDLPFDRQYWVGMSIGSEPEMTPRIPFTSVPYSFQARSVLGEMNTFPSVGDVIVRGGFGLPSTESAESASKILTLGDSLSRVQYVPLATLATLIGSQNSTFQGTLADIPLIVKDSQGNVAHTLSQDGRSTHSGRGVFNGGLEVPNGNSLIQIKDFGIVVGDSSGFQYYVDRSGNSSQKGQFALENNMEVRSGGEIRFESSPTVIASAISAKGLRVPVHADMTFTADTTGLSVDSEDQTAHYLQMGEDGSLSLSEQARFNGGIRLGQGEFIEFPNGPPLTKGDFDGVLTGKTLLVEDSDGTDYFRVNQNGLVALNNSGSDLLFINPANNEVNITGRLDVSEGAFIHGNLTVNGSVNANVKSFQIDHPLDPDNRYLRHASVESSEMKDMYDGVAQLDGNGEAWVTFPAWFEALNENFRYQLTSIGAPAPDLFIANEIEQGRFRIAGGPPGVRISWQVTGIRHDTYALNYPLRVETLKSQDDSH